LVVNISSVINQAAAAEKKGSTFLQSFTVDDRLVCFSCRSIQNFNPILCLQGDADGGARGAVGLAVVLEVLTETFSVN
jgi:hypothetical protein